MMLQMLEKKRDGGELSPQELRLFVQGVTDGSIPDYQISAMLMAIFFRGMTPRETAALTDAMAHSGEICDLSMIPGVKVDKHSSGGVADGVTPVLAPMLAACGAVVAKMSGRGLGHTGGTVDKLESIPGMRVDLSMEEFKHIASETGLCITGQSADLAPADKILYALRDVTGTVPSVALIASSIMSKKLAAGADCIMLDVKCGSGAFMETLPQARSLAKAMVEIGRAAGRKVEAAVTDMNRPLGSMIGNSLEIMETVRALKGELNDSPLMEVCLGLGERLLVMAGISETYEHACILMKRSIADGSAFERFCAFVTAQGGDARALEDFSLLPSARYTAVYAAPKSGFISAMRAERIGTAALELGAGRHVKGERIDYGAGIEMKKTLGDAVQEGEPMAVLHASDERLFAKAAALLDTAIDYSDRPCKLPPLIYEYIQ